MSGQGTYKWPDGTSYTGKWKKGKMGGAGTMTLQNGTKITGNWVSDELEGYALVVEPGAPEQQVKFHRNIVFHQNAPQAREGGSDNQWLNVALVGIGAACGVGYMVKPKEMPGLAVAAGAFYGLQFLESMCSNTFAYLCNIKTPERASDRVRVMIDAKPKCSISIENYHYEDVEIKVEPDNKAAKEFEKK